ncbi:Ohr family peroxiredoxin [Vagococcus coleopterorum]|uniref:Ohr family peroxiredoxin n=1 Tax=Vagococcus coleopterorum TaxID=2714946 RepID=A0A6G8AMP8_9ENTE|nr:Ohr family peroxiredoxin [Vagococcus coleopterorum]QIL46205.1 Ohr family peroxiredoxin [Vagococcus coleopterorum]
MKKVYSTKVINTGGRSGEVRSADGSLSMLILPPGKKGDGATNPEQLFAAGFSACFNSALDYVKEQHNVTGESVVSATVGLYNMSQSALPDVQLGVEIEGHIEGLTLEEAQELLEVAHKVCPYSKAVKNNIELTVKAV